MPHIHIWKCDRCETEQDHHKQMWELGVTIKEARVGVQPGFPMQGLYCRACVVSIFGLIPSQGDDPPVADPCPNIEEMIRQIARDVQEQEP